MLYNYGIRGDEMPDFIIVSFFVPKKKEGVYMNKILKELNGKTSEEILAKYDQIDNIPIDIAKVAKNIGINLGSIDFSVLQKEEPFKSIIKKKGPILGAVFPKDEHVNIIYNNKLYDYSELKNLSDADKKDKLLRRQRFTIAHEIAHCCLHTNEMKDYHIEYRTEQTDYKDEKERQANIFAGELLIPKKIIVTLCAMLEDKVSVSFLADLFKVSKHVMEARLQYLQDIDEIGKIQFI